MIFAFDHMHNPGEICSVAQCVHAARAPVPAGNEVFQDIPMRIVRAASAMEYLSQPIQEGFCLPPLEYNCKYFYEVQVD